MLPQKNEMKTLPEGLSAKGLLIRHEIVNQMDQGKLEVPLLPEIAQRVIALIEDPESDAPQLAQLIQSEPTLAANVMRIANSAAYSPNASIVSLQQAITRLGINVIAEIALSASINTRMFHAPGFESRISEIWRLSLASAFWAKEISRVCRLNVEAAFLCGLLSSIGRAVVLHMASEVAIKTGSKLEADDAFLLEAGLYHELGVKVMEIWKMPKIIIEAIGCQKNYIESRKVPDLARITVAATQFADHTLVEGEVDEDLLRSLPVIAELNLYPEDFDQLFEKHGAVIASVEAMSP